MTDFETKSSGGIILRGALYPAASPKNALSLVHGFGEHQGRYAGMIAALNANGTSVATIDLRGHGLSDGTRGACKDYSLFLADVDALIAKTREAFTGLPHILYGHSMGGGIALRYASEPKRAARLAGLIISAPLITLPAPPPAALQNIIKLVSKIAPNLTLPNVLDGDKITTLKAEQQLYIDDPLNHGKLTTALAVGMVENGEAVLKRAETLALPTLLMHAKDDQLTGFEGSRQFAALAQNCEFHAFENCAHEMHNDVTREQVYALMTDFLNRKIA